MFDNKISMAVNVWISILCHTTASLHANIKFHIYKNDTEMYAQEDLQVSTPKDSLDGLSWGNLLHWTPYDCFYPWQNCTCILFLAVS